jgi:hypothetical protein
MESDSVKFEMPFPILVNLPQGSESGQHRTLHITQRTEKSSEQRIEDQKNAERGDEPQQIRCL